MMTDDSWKGEHLIRAPKRDKPIRRGEVERANATERKRDVALEKIRKYKDVDLQGVRENERKRSYYHKKEPTNFCLSPLCGKPLAPQNTSGLCVKHKHIISLCQCDSCTKRREAKKK